MIYVARLQVGYYEDDDTYHGPFESAIEVDAQSVEMAIALAEERLLAEREELHESMDMTDGTVLVIHDKTGQPVYHHGVGILQVICPHEEPSSEVINLQGVISTELIGYLRQHPNELDLLKPRQFEELIAEILASFGWEVQLTPPIKDGGYDIFAVSKDYKAGTRTSWIIECKKYQRDRRVGVEVARALYGAAGNLGQSNAAMMIATTSAFTKGAIEYAFSKYNFELRDYKEVLEWVNVYKPNPSGRLFIADSRITIC